MKKNLYYLCLVLLSCMAVHVHAQGSIEVSGQVVDSDKLGLPGANVMIAIKFKKEITDGLLKQYVFTAGDRFVPGKHELYPIPAYEVRETKNVIKQNPGY